MFKSTSPTCPPGGRSEGDFGAPTSRPVWLDSCPRPLCLGPSFSITKLNIDGSVLIQLLSSVGPRLFSVRKLSWYLDVLEANVVRRERFAPMIRHSETFVDEGVHTPAG